MAVATTGAIYKSLSFDGVESRNFGVYITGRAVYNAPGRDVEMVEIPGRNGSFALDKGRFQNIEVSYPAGIFADNEADFAEAISDFRNFLCSRRGYVRLTDEYNPNEYRMAIYKSGLEVTPAQLKAGEFTIVFDCKPQRWLTSGEDAVTIGEWGDTETASGAIATFEGDEATGIKSLVVDIEPVQSGSGTPSPDNVRPISGYDSVSVANMGDISERQFFNGLMQGTYGFVDLGTLNWGTIGSRIYTASLASLTPHMASNARIANILTTKYDTISANGTASAVKGISVDTGGAVIVYDAEYSGDAQAFKTAMSGVYLIYELTTPTTPTITKAQFDMLLQQFGIEGELYVTDLNGTRYGGTLDVVSGVLTVTHKLVSISDVSWTYDSAYTRFYHQFSDATEGVTRITKAASSCFESITDGRALSSVPNNAIYFGGGNRTIYIKTTDYTTSSAFVSAFGSQTILYPLDTPTTVQLTAQQVSALVGTNNVWANSGDVTVEYGENPNKIDNPTLFESSPLLIIDGYGNIDIGDQRVVVEDIFIGDVPIGNAQTFNNTDVSLEFDDKASMFNAGDEITIKNIVLRSTMTITNTAYYVQEAGQDDRPMGIIYWNSPNTDATLGYSCSGKVVSFSMTIPQITLTVGVDLKRTYSTRATVKVEINTGSSTEWQRNSEYATTVIDYKDGKIKITAQRLFLDGGQLNYAWPITQNTITIGAINGYSTISIKEGTTYIDCDIGEAYKYEDGQYISLNSSVNLGAELPVLYPGTNDIAYDGTITGLQIVPRWWKI